MKTQSLENHVWPQRRLNRNVKYSGRASQSPIAHCYPGGVSGQGFAALAADVYALRFLDQDPASAFEGHPVQPAVPRDRDEVIHGTPAGYAG